MGRKILFVTTDQQRYDTLGCNGGTLSRTPVVDGLAAAGHPLRAGPPAVGRVHAVALDDDHRPAPAHARRVDERRAAAGHRPVGGRRAARRRLPHGARSASRTSSRSSTRSAASRRTASPAPARSARTAASSTSSSPPTARPARCTTRSGWPSTHPEAVGSFYPVLDGELEVNALGGGDTGAPQVHDNPIPREWYHTDWVADRTIAWLDGLDADDDWFCWMSFPDPHHPWDPPPSELGRVDWRDVPLPAGYIADAAQREAVLDAKPRHWRAWYDGRLVSNYEAPLRWVPATLTADQVREVNARNAVEVELIDEALGRVLAAIAARGWTDDVDVVFTTDHGELQGDFGLLFKGPYHVDGLMRLPLDLAPGAVGRRARRRSSPARSATSTWPRRSARSPASPPATWMEGRALPVADADADARGFERVLTEWDSELFGVNVHLRTIHRDGWVCTTYLPGSEHDGTEGELYSLADDPLQQVNRWDDPALAALRSDLVADLWDHQPPMIVTAAAGGGARLRVGRAVARRARVGSLSPRESAEDPSAGPVPARSRPRGDDRGGAGDARRQAAGGPPPGTRQDRRGTRRGRLLRSGGARPRRARHRRPGPDERRARTGRHDLVRPVPGRVHRGARRPRRQPDRGAAQGGAPAAGRQVGRGHRADDDRRLDRR